MLSCVVSFVEEPTHRDYLAGEGRRIAAEYGRVGDQGILRGFVWGDQAGCWQHACCLMPVEDLILKCMDNPGWVHRLLGALLERKLRFIEESLTGAKFDIVETGGGAASDTVISPKLHREFCLPYDRRMHQALHRAGQRATYHTCGGMMHILDLIVENGADASETLSPPGVGGTITEPARVKAAFRGRLAMIGGLDQFRILGKGSAAEIRQEVRRLFEGFGPDGGYICSASDHFFEVPVENLPLDDASTYDLLNKANTLGVFQLESGGMRDLLRKPGFSSAKGG